MKTAAVIAEFNPFHNGHEYILGQARKRTGADNIIVLMSGDFVQRGQPAIVDRHTRASMALECGADMVINYPVRFCTSSAEPFAYHAVKIIDSLGFVDHLVFGCECDDAEKLERAADILLSPDFLENDRMKEYLKKGMSYPAARAKLYPELESLLRMPNNILAVEYIKALKRIGSEMKICNVNRNSGVGILDQANISRFSGGYELRCALMRLSVSEALKKDIPEKALEIISENIEKKGIVDTDDFSDILNFRILESVRKKVYPDTMDMNEDIFNSVTESNPEDITFSGWAECISSKNYTRTRIDRALLHFILGIKDMDITEEDYYVQILGLNKNKKELTAALKKNCTVPVISKAADAERILSGNALEIFREDVFAADLYESVRCRKNPNSFHRELTKKIVLI